MTAAFSNAFGAGFDALTAPVRFRTESSGSYGQSLESVSVPTAGLEGS